MFTLSTCIHDVVVFVIEAAQNTSARPVNIYIMHFSFRSVFMYAVQVLVGEISRRLTIIDHRHDSELASHLRNGRYHEIHRK